MDKTEKEEFYMAIGQREGIMKVVKIFYDKVYKHPWISQYFKNIPQEHIENQQADFMTGALGGPKKYAGRLPIPAHEHMYIDEELFELRNQLLREAIQEVGVSQELQDAWLKIDNAFKAGIVKNSRSECKKRYFTDEILDFPNPNKKAA